MNPARDLARRSLPRILIATALAWLLPSGMAAAQGTLPLERIRLPEGCTIELVARVPGAREMTFGARGTLFVGSTQGSTYALSFPPGGNAGPTVRVVASGLRQPSGIAFHDGALYVAEVTRVLRFDGIESKLEHPPRPVAVMDVPEAQVR